MQKKIDIIEVARQAGVSIATVSRVINNASVVKEETRKKVLEVLESTNYRVNAAAKHLRTRRSYNIGIIYISVMMDFFNTISLGVEDVARENGYSVFFCNSGDDPEKEEEYLSSLFEKRVDGIILSPTGKNAEALQHIMNNDIPVCFIDRIVKGVGTDTVIVDNHTGSKDAVEHLIKAGYRSIGCIAGPQGSSNAVDRHQGYIDAFKANRMKVNEAIVRYGDFTFESGYELAGELISQGGLDSLFVANERMGGGALKLLREKRITPKKDLGFLMWDNPFWTSLVSPSISVVAQPVYGIGTTAAQLLFERIEKSRQENPRKANPATVTLKPELIIREST